MADQPQSGAASSAFPAPPPFWKSFTSENLERQKELLDSNDQSSSTPSSPPQSKLDLLSLPPELRNLFPPPPPPDGKYRSFGIEHDVRIYVPTCYVPKDLAHAVMSSGLFHVSHRKPKPPHACPSTDPHRQPPPLFPQLNQHSSYQSWRLCSDMGFSPHIFQGSACSN